MLTDRHRETIACCTACYEIQMNVDNAEELLEFYLFFNIIQKSVDVSELKSASTYF
jgi:hypothetical protein